MTVLLLVPCSGCATWTAGTNGGECDTCRPGPLRSLVHAVQCVEIPCAIAIPQPSWARDHGAEQPSISREEIIQVRGRFHAVPTRPVFAPKPEVVLERGGVPTPAPTESLTPVPEPEPAAEPPTQAEGPPMLRKPGPRRPNGAPAIPMQAPADPRTAESAPASGEQVSLAVEVVEAEEVGPRLAPPVQVPTRPRQDAWRRRSTR
ncbi:MAG: hypothetical protein U0836_12695 [Pirellulales bacterium]